MTEEEFKDALFKKVTEGGYFREGEMERFESECSTISKELKIFLEITNEALDAAKPKRRKRTK